MKHVVMQPLCLSSCFSVAGEFPTEGCSASSYPTLLSM